MLLVKSEQMVSGVACDTIFAADGALDFTAGTLIQALPGSEGDALVVDRAAEVALRATERP